MSLFPEPIDTFPITFGQNWGADIWVASTGDTQVVVETEGWLKVFLDMTVPFNQRLYKPGAFIHMLFIQPASTIVTYRVSYDPITDNYTMVPNTMGAARVDPLGTPDAGIAFYYGFNIPSGASTVTYVLPNSETSPGLEVSRIGSNVSIVSVGTPDASNVITFDKATNRGSLGTVVNYRGA